MNMIYGVIRQSDTGDADMLALFTDETKADDFAAWINANESPGYSAFVDCASVDDFAFINEHYKAGVER